MWSAPCDLLNELLTASCQAKSFLLRRGSRSQSPITMTEIGKIVGIFFFYWSKSAGVLVIYLPYNYIRHKVIWFTLIVIKNIFTWKNGYLLWYFISSRHFINFIEGCVSLYPEGRYHTDMFSCLYNSLEEVVKICLFVLLPKATWAYW